MLVLPIALRIGMRQAMAYQRGDRGQVAAIGIAAQLFAQLRREIYPVARMKTLAAQCLYTVNFQRSAAGLKLLEIAGIGICC